MILLSSPLKNDPLETTVSIFFIEIEIFTTKTVNSKSLKKICRQLLSTMNVLKVSSQSRKFEFDQRFSIIHVNGITFDVLDRCQENKALQTAQIMNNIPRSSKKW